MSKRKQYIEKERLKCKYHLQGKCSNIYLKCSECNEFICDKHIWIIYDACKKCGTYHIDVSGCYSSFTNKVDNRIKNDIYGYSCEDCYEEPDYTSYWDM